MAKKPAVVWQVYRLAKKAVWIGRVEAAALKAAIEQLEIPPKDRFRISVRRV